MKKSIALILLLGAVGLLAFVPAAAVEITNTPTPTPTLTQVSDAPLEGMAIWCLPEGITYPKDPAEIQKNDQAIAIEYDAGYTFRGPYSACFIQLPLNNQYEDATVAFFDISNSSSFYTQKFYKNGDGLIAVVNHSYLVDAPYWQTHYRIEIQAEDGSVLFSAPLLYAREWQAERCWNGNMPNPVTYRCPLQQDLHPWDAGYGKPLPTLKPEGD